MSDSNIRDRIVNDLGTNFIVEASAGSGKTTILVDRMVALVESGVPISEITAITFTKKAANEFYERFYNKLSKRSKPDFKKDEHDILPEPDDIKRHYDELALKDIDLCFMGTIDAYCNKLLTEHPLDANVPCSAKVVENDEDLSTLINQFFDLCLTGKYGPNIRDFAEKFLDFHPYRDFAKLVIETLSDRAYTWKYMHVGSQEFSDRLEDYYSKLETFRNFLLRVADTTFSKATGDSQKCIDYIKKNKRVIQKASEFDFVKWWYIFKSCNKLRVPFNDASFLTNDELEILCLYKAKTDRGSSYYFSTSNTKDMNISPLVSLYHEIKYTYTMELLSLIRPFIFDYLKKYGALTFNDTMVYLNELLKQDVNDSIGVIKKVRFKHTHYLIDEFQDTSPLQAEIFFHLTAVENKEDWHQCVPRAGSMFLVGDPKQGIYHFRGADINSYLSVVDLFSNPLVGEKLVLTSNFRSLYSLREFFNHTFERDKDKNAQGLFEENANFQAKYTPIDMNIGRTSSDSFQGAYSYAAEKKSDIDYVPKLILSIIEHGKINGKQISFKDFMVITKSVASVKAYRDALVKHGIPCRPEGSVDFSSPKIIGAALALFNYLSSPSDISKFKLLSSPLYDIDLSKVNYDTEALKGLDELLRPKYDELPSMFLERIIESESFICHISMDGFDLLLALIDLLRDAEQNGLVYSFDTANSYITELLTGKGVERIALLDEHSDAVRVANLHKMKGLEAPIVILTYSSGKKRICNSHHDEQTKESLLFNVEETFSSSDGSSRTIKLIESNQFDSSFQYEKEYSEYEYIRLLYVGATRAKNVLFINAAPSCSYWRPLLNNNVVPYPDDISYQETTKNYKKISFKDINNKYIDNHKSLSKPTYNVVNPSKTLSLSKKENDYFTKKIDASLKGTLVHEMMEALVNSKGAVSIEVCRSIASDHDALQYQKLLEEVYDTITHGGYEQVESSLNDIFDYIKNFSCHAEVPFAYKKEDSIYHGVIDLVIETDNKWIIVDYKTDADINTDHASQLKCYVEAIKACLGIDAVAYIYNIPLQ